TPVLAVELRDRPGSLAKVLDILAENDVGIEYMYAFTSSTEAGAYVVMRVGDNDKAEKVLNAAGIKVAGKEEFYN
ncbi:MAG: ACT domain-containing protein, partial [Oscillospiraceae bacterium]|nr:ACT domain-containing protein [Oscillospiraceae bacterium]